MNKRKTKAVLILSQCIYTLFLAAWFFFAMVSVMMFDAPGSEENSGLVLLFTLIWMYPLGLIAGVIGSWIAFRKEKLRQAFLWNAIPLVWLLPIAAVLVYANTR